MRKCRTYKGKATACLLLFALFLFSFYVSTRDSLLLSTRNVASINSTLQNFVSWNYAGKGRGAVCFYGINRSLKHTASSIQMNLLDPISLAGYDLDLFYHTYNLSVIDNPRSKEVRQKLDPSGFNILGSYVDSDITSQEDFMAMFDLRDWIMHDKDNWNDDFKSLKNLACQLNSIDSCCNLIDSSRQRYNFVMFARPDLLYLNSVNMSQIEAYLSSNERVWVLPEFQDLDTFWNDRFVVASHDDIQPWCHRMRYAKDFMREKNQTVHSEMLVKYVGETEGIQKRAIDLKVVRVRADGMINSDDVWLEQWNMTELIGHRCNGPCI